MDNKENKNKCWIGVIPSIIQWLIYGIDIILISIEFLIDLDLGGYGGVWRYVNDILISASILHIIEFSIYMIIGVFQVLSIQIKKYNKFRCKCINICFGMVRYIVFSDIRYIIALLKKHYLC